jgi:hypothetical protein
MGRLRHVGSIQSRVESEEAARFRQAILTRGLRRLFTNTCAASSPPDITTPSHEPLSSSCGRIDGRPNIKMENREPVGVRVRRVVVNHVSDFFRAVRSLANDVPIMAIERRVRPFGSN